MFVGNQRIQEDPGESLRAAGPIRARRKEADRSTERANQRERRHSADRRRNDRLCELCARFGFRRQHNWRPGETVVFGGRPTAIALHELSHEESADRWFEGNAKHLFLGKSSSPTGRLVE